MVGIIWDIIKIGFGWLGKILGLLKSPIKIEVEALSYELIRNSNTIILAPHPSRYRGKLSLTNKTGTPIFLKSIILTINNLSYQPAAKDIAGMRIEARQLLKMTLIFPVPEQESVREGRFELKVIPATGKSTTLMGNFPIRN